MVSGSKEEDEVSPIATLSPPMDRKMASQTLTGASSAPTCTWKANCEKGRIDPVQLLDVLLMLLWSSSRLLLSVFVALDREENSRRVCRRRCLVERCRHCCAQRVFVVECRVVQALAETRDCKESAS